MPYWLPTPAAFALAATGSRPDPLLEKILRRWLVSGLLAVALVPALRGSSEWLGWWPMWLVAMPGVAWWALYRFRVWLPRRALPAHGRRRGQRQSWGRCGAGRAGAKRAA